jgi:hypothetical protein
VSILGDYRHPPRVRRVLESLAAVVCPPEAVELGLTGAIVDHAELSMRALPAALRAGLVAGSLAYDTAAMAWPPARGRRAAALPRDLAERWYLIWAHSPLLPQRQLIMGMKQLLCLAHYEQPAIQESIGYTPDAWIDKVKRRRLMTYSDDIRRHDESLLAPDPLPAGGFVRDRGQDGHRNRAKEAG